MYRCRRLIAVVLSLAVVASAFILNSYAEETEFNGFAFSINGYSYVLTEGNGASFTVPAHSSLIVTFNYIQPRNGTYSPLDCTFNVRSYSSLLQDGNGNLSFNISDYSNISTALLQSRMVTFKDYDRIAQSGFSKLPYGFHISGSFSSSSQVSLNQSSTWTNTTDYDATLYLIFEDVNIGFSTAYWANNSLLVYLQRIINPLNTLVNRFTEQLFNFTSISYDTQGNVSITQQNGNWLNAILGSLNSILAPIRQQVEQEQKAKDAGAYDALDDAFDNAGSSFGSLGDFGTVSDIAPFNPGSFDDNAEINILDWFSAETRDNIDTVPRTRANEIEVIDFYHSHINQYLEEVEPDDSAD